MHLRPDDIHPGDVRTIARSMLHKAVGGVNVILTLLLAGPPCPGLTSLNRARAEFEDPRNQLLFEIERHRLELEAEGLEPRLLAENVNSISREGRK